MCSGKCLFEVFHTILLPLHLQCCSLLNKANRVWTTPEYSFFYVLVFKLDKHKFLIEVLFFRHSASSRMTSTPFTVHIYVPIYMFIKRLVNKNVIQHKLNLSIDVFCFNASFKSTAPSLPIEMPLKKKSMSAYSPLCIWLLFSLSLTRNWKFLKCCICLQELADNHNLFLLFNCRDLMCKWWSLAGENFKRANDSSQVFFHLIRSIGESASEYFGSIPNPLTCIKNTW